MLKKISLVILFFMLASCTQRTVDRQSVQYKYPSRIETYDVEDYENYEDRGFEKDSFKVAMLLPLSGKASTFGNGLQNAAMMALEDTKNPKLQVRFYDTKSSSQGAAAALETALNNKAELILGPLMSEEVLSVSSMAQARRVPLISFSTSPQVLGEGIYTLGLLSNEQINRIISYAARSGRKSVALVTPDNEAGLNVAKSVYDAAGENAMTLVKIGFYEPSTLEFSELVQQMIKSKDFDVVLIADTGSRLKAIAGTFGYYDISYPGVLFVGTSVWENTNLTKETTLFNGVYPVLSRVHQDYFNRKYKELFDETPNTLYSYAYDGVALASALSASRGGDLYAAIENEDGYIGINGMFRLFSDGTNEHNLDVVEISSSGIQTVDSAPSRFGMRQHNMNYSSGMRPEIYGKNPESVYQKLFPIQRESLYFNVF